MRIGISACLLGYDVRYDGSSKRNAELIELLEGHEVIPVCPELAAGFSIPRETMEIIEGRVISKSGIDLTDRLYDGCLRCLEKVKDCDLVILKTRSPSCGLYEIYDGSFSGRMTAGNGLFAQLCINEKIRTVTEDDPDLSKIILFDE